VNNEDRDNSHGRPTMATVLKASEARPETAANTLRGCGRALSCGVVSFLLGVVMLGVVANVEAKKRLCHCDRPVTAGSLCGCLTNALQCVRLVMPSGEYLACNMGAPFTCEYEASTNFGMARLFGDAGVWTADSMADGRFYNTNTCLFGTYTNGTGATVEVLP